MSYRLGVTEGQLTSTIVSVTLPNDSLVRTGSRTTENSSPLSVTRYQPIRKVDLKIEEENTPRS
eukprot:scaffold6982_cov449-Prasinococcus_capsulatus_cf.AAC.2